MIAKRYPTFSPSGTPIFTLKDAFYCRMVDRWFFSDMTMTHIDSVAHTAINHYAEQLAARYQRMFGSEAN